MTVVIDDHTRQVTKLLVNNPDGTVKCFEPPFDHTHYELEDARFYMSDAIKNLKKDNKSWLARRRNRTSTSFGPIQPAIELMSKVF